MWGGVDFINIFKELFSQPRLGGVLGYGLGDTKYVHTPVS